VWAVAGSVDLGLTAANRTLGGSENNPLYRWTNRYQPAPAITIMGASSTAAVWALHRWAGKKHPRLIAIGLYVAAGIHTAYAIEGGIHLQHRLEQRRRACRAPIPYACRLATGGF